MSLLPEIIEGDEFSPKNEDILFPKKLRPGKISITRGRIQTTRYSYPAYYITETPDEELSDRIYPEIEEYDFEYETWET